MKNIIANKKNIFVALILVMAAGSFLGAEKVGAEVVINSVKINGADNALVSPGSPVTATINVTLTNSSIWRSTGYKIGNGNMVCVDTPDHSASASSTETFSITAPSKQGTANVSFEIFENNDCTNGIGMAEVSASLSSAVAGILSLGMNKIWLPALLMALIIILAFIIFQNGNGKKQ